MNRLAQLLHCPRHCIPLVLFRWLLLAMTFVGMAILLWTKPWPGSAPLFALGYATVYLVLWTVRLPALAIRRPATIALLCTDLVLSVGAAWLAGTWGSALTPFVLGALVLPGALFGSLGACVAVASYIGMLLAYRFLHLPGGTLWSDALPFEYAKALVAAFIWPVSVALQRHWPRQARPLLLTPRPHVGSTLTTLLPPLAPPEARFGPHLLPAQSAGRRSSDGPQPATLERRATRLHTAVRQVVTEAQQHGLMISVSIEGREPVMPVGYVPLLIKAIEVALDNVRQHAGTMAAELQLINAPATIYLRVRDHGAGLLDGTTDLPGFHHLKLLRYQFNELGGTLEITEPDDDGVLFALTLPLAT